MLFKKTNKIPQKKKHAKKRKGKKSFIYIIGAILLTLVLDQIYAFGLNRHDLY